MAESETTTVTVSTDTRDELFQRKRHSSETYEDVLQRLLSN